MAEAMALLAEKLKPKFFFNGIPFVYGNQVRFDLIKQASEMEFLPSDIILCGYPRSGTTWHKMMLWLALNNADVETAKNEPIRNRILFLEKWYTEPGDKMITEKIKAAKEPRIFYTHLPYCLLSKQIKKANAKIVCVMRNPKDVITSGFYAKDTLASQVGDFPGLKFEHLLMYMMSPHSDGGHILQHVKGFWENKDDLDICYMFFEESKKDPAASIRKMANFGGKELSDEQIEAAIDATGFKKMQAAKRSNAFVDQSKYNFCRKGEIGDWMNHFTVAQNELFDRFMVREIGDLKIPYQFQ